MAAGFWKLIAQYVVTDPKSPIWRTKVLEESKEGGGGGLQWLPYTKVNEQISHREPPLWGGHAALQEGSPQSC